MVPSAFAQGAFPGGAPALPQAQALPPVPAAPSVAPQGAQAPVSGTPGTAAAAPGQPGGAPVGSTVGGAPFPGMIQGGPGQQGAAARPPVPLSGQPMSIDDAEVRNRITRMGEQVNDRLGNLRVGSGDLAAPDLSPRRSELEERASAERQLRELELRQRQADAAMKLWATVYDPRREEDAARRAAAAAEGAAAGSPGTQMAPGTAIPIAPSSQAPSAAPVVTVPQLVPPQPTAAAPATPAPAAERAPTRADLPMPKVVTIRGGGSGPLTAQILVPYVGEVAAEVGTRLPGDRRVTRITASSVIISDPDLGTIPLGFGDSVALAPPAAAQRAPAVTPINVPQAPQFPPITVPQLPPVPVAPLPLTPSTPQAR